MRDDDMGGYPLTDYYRKESLTPNWNRNLVFTN